MNIQPVNLLSVFKNNFVANKQASKNDFKKINHSDFFSYPKNYFAFSFTGRVDKSLNAFMERNKGLVPFSVSKYVDTLSVSQREYISPLQAQKEAYADLEKCETVEDVKEKFPDEPLFNELKNSSETKATHGILYDISVMADVFNESEENIISNGEDLTVYLLKKLFMEAKTIDETNNDLNEDINPVLQKDDKNYISSTTLKALGIKLPSVSYLNSLKYTRDGYSDAIGQQISDRWNSLSEEEKINRIALLLKNSMNLSPEKREELRKLHSKLMKLRWENMSASEKVAQIEKMQSGNFDSRTIMTFAWNNAHDLREQLSKYFVANNFYNPQSIIYRDSSFNNSMSVLMKDFWKNNPKAALQFGEILSFAHEEFNKAKEDGKLEEFVAKTYEDRDKYRKEIKELAIQLRKSPQGAFSFEENFNATFSYLPDDLKSYISETVSRFPQEHQEIYLKACLGMNPKKKDEEIISEIDSSLGNLDFDRYAALLYSAQKMFYDALKPHNGIKSPYMVSNHALSFHSILGLFSKIKKQGYQNITLEENLLDNPSYQNAFYRMNAFERLCNGDEIEIREGVFTDRYKLSKYKYSFRLKPDFDAFKANYDKYLSPLSEDDKMKLSGIAYNALSGINNYISVRNVFQDFFELGNTCKIILDDELLGFQYWIDGFNIVKRLCVSAKERKICDQVIEHFSDKLSSALFSSDVNC